LFPLCLFSSSLDTSKRLFLFILCLSNLCMLCPRQFCGSELIFFVLGPTKIFFRIRICRLIFWPQICLNGASNCFHMCSGTCTTEKHFFQYR
jgi:hypothetical protein